MLPIEIIGPVGYEKSITVNMNNGSTGVKLWMLINNLSYNNKMAIKINQSSYVSINNSNTKTLAPYDVLGGIGGSSRFGTAKFVYTLPSGLLVNGSNTITFKFNTSDSVSSGYRILKFNILDANDTKLISESVFQEDDPNSWQPPINNPTAIAEGKDLWENKTLWFSSENKTFMQAKCQNCHVKNGYDLKYFNYSNHSIIERSKFHGLTQVEAEKIASYIRSLEVPNPGRPWNPPYQPGPGTDQKPVQEWAAGAGLDAVLEDDKDALPYIFPNMVLDSASISIKKWLNVREIPTNIQFLDWKHWLPIIHPMDAFSDYNTSQWKQKYEEIYSKIFSANSASYKLGAFQNDLEDFRLKLQYGYTDDKVGQGVDPGTKEHRIKIYSLMLFQAVKLFELIHVSNSEGLGPQLYGTWGEARTWPGIYRHIYEHSPHFLKLDMNDPNNIYGDKYTQMHMNNTWYFLQFVLNSGNGRSSGFHPVDWRYSHNFAWYYTDFSYWLDKPYSNRTYSVAMFIKAMQDSDKRGIGPDQPFPGWDLLRDVPIDKLVSFDPNVSTEKYWGNIPNDQRNRIIEAILRNWLGKSKSYSVAQWQRIENDDYAIPPPTYNFNSNPDGHEPDILFALIPEFRRLGVNCQLLNQMIDFCNQLWPNVKWNDIRTTCNVVVPTSITLSKSQLTLSNCGTFQLIATVLPTNNTNNGNITWVSSNSSIVEVNGVGLLTPKSLGTAVITATTLLGNQSVSCTVQVLSVSIPITNFTLTPSNASISSGSSTLQLTADYTPFSICNTISYSSSDNRIATVSSNGLVSAIGAGIVTITAFLNGSSTSTTVNIADDAVCSYSNSNILDDFNRSSGLSNWQGDLSKFILSNNELTLSTASGFKGIVYSTLFGSSQDVYFKINAPVSLREIGVILKSDVDFKANSINVSIIGDAVEIWTVTNRVYTRHAILRISFNQGDYFGVRALPSGRIEVYRNNTFVGSANIPSNWVNNQTGGRIGICVEGSNFSLDNFGGGNTCLRIPVTCTTPSALLCFSHLSNM